MQPLDDLASFLNGNWRLERRIELRHSDQQATASGMAAWSAAEVDRLVYDETAILSIDGQDLKTTRSLALILRSPTAADVLFGDGRFFHHLDLADGHYRATHHCGDDVYVGHFDVVDHDRIIERWEVQGPAKDYTSTTTLIADQSPVTGPAEPSGQR